MIVVFPYFTENVFNIEIEIHAFDEFKQLMKDEFNIDGFSSDHNPYLYTLSIKKKCDIQEEMILKGWINQLDTPLTFDNAMYR